MDRTTLRDLGRALVRAAVAERLRNEGGRTDHGACPPGVSEEFFRSLLDGHGASPTSRLEVQVTLAWPDLDLGVARRATFLVRARFSSRARVLLDDGGDPDMARMTALCELAAEETVRASTSRVWDAVLAGRATR